jgi:hypothetical protein
MLVRQGSIACNSTLPVSWSPSWSSLQQGMQDPVGDRLRGDVDEVDDRAGGVETEPGQARHVPTGHRCIGAGEALGSTHSAHN